MRSLFVVVVLIAALVHQGTAQLPFGPVFHLSQYLTSEGRQQVVRLSASILTSSPISFNGSIEVDIAAEDGSAEFDPLLRIFTVAFLSRQANSTEHPIRIFDDVTFEGRETLRLRIVETRFLGQAATVFRAQDRLNETTADVIIEDNDYIEVNWTISEPIEVIEGDGVEVRLRAEAFGFYANPIQIGVACAPTQVTGVPAASLGRDFIFTPGTRIDFTDVETLQSISFEELVVPIRNDDIAEPCESFICTLQGGALDAVRGIEPNRVTIQICDDDALIVRWAQDVYEFTESQLATVELVTNSTFEVDQVSIQGFPRQIPDDNPNRLPSLVVPGPAFIGFSFNATIERITSPKVGGNFGNAQVAQSGRPDVVSTINDFVFTPASQSAFDSFTIVNDSVLEFEELFIAEFNFGPEIANTWNAIKGEPSTAFIVIRDDDYEKLSVPVRLSSVVVVNFNESRYTVAENAGQVSVSLRIDGKFFYPVWAIVEISDGTATDPDDYSSARSYNVTFRQTAFTDGEDPDNTALSSPILIDIVNDDVSEGVEYFQAHIVETSDEVRVRIGQNTVNVTINDESHPRIIKPPEDLQVVNGVTVTYDCVALAQPIHSLTWYFISANGSNSTIGSVSGTMKSIANSGKYQITDNSISLDEYGRLLIRNVQFEDRGTYLCHARNRLGPVIASATLSVQVPPVFLSISPQMDVAINTINDAVTLKCSVRGYPLVSLHWRKDGTLLDPDDSHINITTLRRQNPMDSYQFSTALDSSFQPIPLENLEYFEAVSELTLVPPIVRSDTANYTCEVESDFVQNYTVTSDNIPVNVFVSIFIQLLLRPVSDCLTWAETDSAVKLSDISAALSAPLQQQCSCSLSVQQSLFSCFETTDSQTVVFLAELSYTALPRVDMPSFLTSWITSTPYITVVSTQLQMDTTCPVVIDSLQPEPCSAVSVTPSTIPPADPSSNPATDSSTGATVIVVVVAVAVVVLLVMLTAIVVIVIAVIVFCSKQSKYSPRPSRSLPNPVHKEYEYMDNESWGMAMTSMTKNPSYTTTKEVLASFMFNGEEDEADHTYEVLPFEANEGDPDNPTHSSQETAADNPACE